MSEVLQLKRDPAWLTSLPFIAETVILLQGYDPKCQVSVPAALLLASSPLVRNILSAGHLPPAFSTPVISFPSVAVDILESVMEMLVSGIARLNMNRLSGVREVLKMMGIDGWMCVQTERITDVDDKDTVRDLIKVKSQVDHENVKLEIVVKLEKESDAEDEIFHLNKTTCQSSKSCFGREKIKNKTVSKESLKKHLPPRIERLKNTGNLEEPFFAKSSGQKEKPKKQNFSSNLIQDKYSSESKKSCPQCGKKIVRYKLSRHIKSVHNKETVQCPLCNKTLGTYTLDHHIRFVHQQTKKTCPQCDKKFSSLSISKHIRVVHSKETVKCPRCDKTLAYTSLNAHIRFVHEQKKQTCPHCEKKITGWNLPKHIREAHNKETVSAL